MKLSTRMKECLISIAMMAIALTSAAETTATFFEDSPSPIDYVLSRLRENKVVIFGEAHWLREEAGMIRDLVPLLPDNGTHTLAIEVFQASKQELIDAIVSAGTWDEGAAMEILREAGMPHEEYLEIIEAVWRTRRRLGNDSLQLIAMGPGHDFRERLPEGETYDSFMASKVRGALSTRRGSVLVYCGLHHAFTRYLQPETTLDGRARGFMIRMGNILSWELGEQVFVVMSHRPIPCGSGDDWHSCTPFSGQIDCAAEKSGRGPFAFDVASSPFAGLRFGRQDLYSPGYPDLRLVDFVDGMVWFAPIDQLHPTRLIPLTRLAPSEDAIAAVAKSNPFDDRTGLAREALESLWRDEAKRAEQPILESRWKGIGDWRERCHEMQP